MAQDGEHKELLVALAALSPDELNGLLRRVRGLSDGHQAEGTAPALVLTNLGPEPLHARVAGLDARGLAPGERFEVAIQTVPLPQRLPGGPSAERGFDVAPAGLVSARIAAELPDSGGQLGIDLRLWIKHAARFGVPHGYVQGAVRGDRSDGARKGGGWSALDSPLSEWRVAAGHRLELVVVGVGLDLSGLAVQFADLLSSAREQGTSK